MAKIPSESLRLSRSSTALGAMYRLVLDAVILFGRTT